MFKSLIKFFFPTLYKVEVVKRVEVVHVLSDKAFSQLAARLPNPVLSASDTPSVASHKLGVQLALNELRKGFVV